MGKRSLYASQTIYDEQVIQIRKNKQVQHTSLSDYANLYFQPKNPMLYRLLSHKKEKESIVILQIDKSILKNKNVIISNANAATGIAHFFEDVAKGIAALDFVVTKREEYYWHNIIDGKAKSMAECLVLNHIPKKHIIGMISGKPDTDIQRLASSCSVNGRKNK